MLPLGEGRLTVKVAGSCLRLDPRDCLLDEVGDSSQYRIEAGPKTTTTNSILLASRLDRSDKTRVAQRTMIRSRPAWIL